MIMHVTLGSNDLGRSAVFYGAVMPILHHARAPILLENFLAFVPISGEGGEAAAGPFKATGRIGPFLCICRPYDGKRASPGNGFQVAWVAPTKTAVETFHAVACAHGGADAGAPGYRVRYGADYFAACIRDPDGNRLQAVFYESGRKAGPGGTIVSHVTLPVDDLEIGLAFFEPVLGCLGIGLLEDNGDRTRGYIFSRDDCDLPAACVQQPDNGKPAEYGNGQHVSFFAETSAMVDLFYETALALGARDDGRPGIRAEYTQPYYAAYIRAPSGTKIQAVCKTGR